MEPIDLRIIEQLDTNSRASYPEIASKLGTSSRTVQRKVSRMIENGFIRSFEIIPDPSLVGVGEAVCDIQIQHNVSNDRTRKQLMTIPNISEILTLAGGSLVGYLYYRDSVELETIFHRIGATYGVADLQYEVASRYELTKPALSLQSWRIINSLNHQARKLLSHIAKETELSTRTVQRSLRALNDTGSVRFGVDIDMSKAGELFVYILLIRVQLGTSKQKIQEEIRRQVPVIWRSIKTVNPFSIILSLYAETTAELGRAVETVRLVSGVAALRIMIITGDAKNTKWFDLLLAEKAGSRSLS